ncbi:MAG: hypothetical protein RL023_265, partial [Candidatus Parcubacteria bacterium]
LNLTKEKNRVEAKKKFENKLSELKQKDFLEANTPINGADYQKDFLTNFQVCILDQDEYNQMAQQNLTINGKKIDGTPNNAKKYVNEYLVVKFKSKPFTYNGM